MILKLGPTAKIVDERVGNPVMPIVVAIEAAELRMMEFRGFLGFLAFEFPDRVFDEGPHIENIASFLDNVLGRFLTLEDTRILPRKRPFVAIEHQALLPMPDQSPG